jgi:Zn-dependent M28 family amino/carboxypeptidase
MHRSKAALILLLLCSAGGARARTFNGEKALAYTREAVNDGPRPSGSPAIHQLQEQIGAALKRAGCQISFDAFTATTPAGPVPMRNILCKFPGKSGKAIVITGHYDTKRLLHFVGANDGASSTGFLMEMADALSGAPRVDDVILAFFDGEEAVNRQWAGTDNTYGSRHLADVWEKDGTLARVKGLINVDMIGDKDLDILYDNDSNPELRDMVFDLANNLGYGSHFQRQPNAIEDDHMPFMQKGVRALDLIDFTYGPNNMYWHSPGDTMDKLSAQSFEIVGTVVMDAIRKLEEKP